MTMFKISTSNGITCKLNASDMILKGLCKSKFEDSVQLQTVMAFVSDQEVARNQRKPNYLLKTSVKLHLHQMMKTRNIRVRSDVVERGSVTKSQKGNRAYVERKVRGCFQWKAHGQCSKGDSWTKRTIVFSCIPKSKETDGEGQKSSQGSGSNRNVDESETPCRLKLCKNPSCKFWHLSVCLNDKSEKGWCAWQQMSFPTY